MRVLVSAVVVLTSLFAVMGCGSGAEKSDASALTPPAGNAAAPPTATTPSGKAASDAADATN